MNNQEFSRLTCSYTHYSEWIFDCDISKAKEYHIKWNILYVDWTGNGEYQEYEPQVCAMECQDYKYPNSDSIDIEEIDELDEDDEYHKIEIVIEN